jgi:two-component system, OmpR family, response regulator
MTGETRQRTALVIDDDPFIGELLEVLLGTQGYGVEIITDGIDAIELKRDYDVILLDLKMPIFDGERLAAYWMLTKPDVLKRVIVLSGYSRFTEGRKLPAFAVLEKPFEYAALLRAVEACAAQSAAGEIE